MQYWLTYIFFVTMQFITGGTLTILKAGLKRRLRVIVLQILEQPKPLPMLTLSLQIVVV